MEPRPSCLGDMAMAVMVDGVEEEAGGGGKTLRH